MELSELNNDQRLSALKQLQDNELYKKEIEEVYEAKINNLEEKILSDIVDNSQVYSDEDLVRHKRKIWLGIDALQVSDELAQHDGWKQVKEIIEEIICNPKTYKAVILHQNVTSLLLNEYFSKDKKANDIDLCRVERSVYVDLLNIAKALIDRYSQTPNNSKLDPYQYPELDKKAEQ